MFHVISNLFKDLLGANRLVLFRTFKQFNWGKVNPMFNVVEVPKGQENRFITFLLKANRISSRVNSPVSMGPYQVEGQRVFISITHYGSVFRFVQMIGVFLFTGLGLMRAKATQTAIWTFCANDRSIPDSKLDNVYVLGIKGNPDRFLTAMADQNIQSASFNTMIHNVRGRVYGDHYFVFSQTPEHYSFIQDFAVGGGAFVLYKAAQIPDTLPK